LGFVKGIQVFDGTLAQFGNVGLRQITKTGRIFARRKMKGQDSLLSEQWFGDQSNARIMFAKKVMERRAKHIQRMMNEGRGAFVQF
jgi:hypothetical protein